MNTELYSHDLETFRVQEYVGHLLGLPPRLYAIDLQNRHYKCGRFQTLRYSCTHVHAACAHAKLDVEQFIDEVYMLQYTVLFVDILNVDHS
ncbi:hypothetical protein GOBAR_DD05237 [Gossypium barbadense]|nr:hypothetical protein GOBAR_DD05237 [Gossypium barbadense]